MKKIIILAILIRLFFIFGKYHPDVGNHLDWGIKFWEYGPRNFYEESVWGVSWPNQPPGTIYLWAILAKIKEIFLEILWWFNLNFRLFPSNLIPFFEMKIHPAFVKLPSIFSEIGIGWLIYLIVQRYTEIKRAKLASSFFLLNPITIYNSAIWGQTEGLISFFGLLAIYFFLIKKPILAMMAYFISLYFKVSLIIFFPVVLILLLRSNFNFYKFIASILIPLLIILSFSLPFITKKNVFNWLIDLYLNKVISRQGNMLTGNAFNLWAFLFGIDLTRSDRGHFLFLTFHQWGQGLFLILNLPLILTLVLKKNEWQRVFFVLFLISFSSFLFLTNMHERYLYFIFPYLSILIGFYRKFRFSFVIISLIHLLNLYNLWYYPRIEFLRKILDWKGAVMTRLFSFFLLGFYFYFFLIFFHFFKNSKIGRR